MKQQQLPVKQQETVHTGFSLPALQIPNKHYSLEADMINGWQPKMKVIGPVPLNFDAPICDEVVETLTIQGARANESIVYLGPRYASSFKMHQEMRRDYSYKYEAIINTNFPHLAAYFRKFYGHFKPKHTRPFKGMNPTIKLSDTAVFDGLFESANLDAVIKVGPHEYDIFMRVDSNTRGHMHWYNFTVRGGNCKKVKLNIVNFRRSKTLYNMSLKPYFWSSFHRGVWKQGGSNVKYEQKSLRYKFLQQIFSEERLLFNCLSFCYQFEDENEVVQFAYCPPFTYTDSTKMIESLYTCPALLSDPAILKEQVAGQTLGGLEISLLTITDPTVPDAYKKCVLVSARIHPGQTCGSFMVKGFLEFLCSNQPEAVQLRKKIVFKVIPMANPDGVVAGNFRTSLCGRDLNRMFRSEQGLLIPQVAALKTVTNQLRSLYKGRLMFFLDFHGHSVRKNVFIYGPEYQIWETNYYRTRILPKLISQKTEMFRYYSCSFRISSEKKTTARAVLLKYIPHCYTIEASVGSYYSPTDKKDYDFTPFSWQLMGKMVADSMNEYFHLLDENMVGKERKDVSEKDKFNLPKVQISCEKTRKKFNLSKGQSQPNKKMSLERTKQIEKQPCETNQFSCLSDRAKEIIEQIKLAEKDIKVNNQHYSEGGSDSESSEDDLEDKELSTLHHHIILSLKEFKQRFYNRDDPSKRRQSPQSSAQIPYRKLQMIASLRKKVENVNLTKSDTGNDSIIHSIGLPKGWINSKTSRRASGYSAAENQSFQVYVTKLKVGQEEQEDCSVSYLSSRKKRVFG